MIMTDISLPFALPKSYSDAHYNTPPKIDSKFKWKNILNLPYE